MKNFIKFLMGLDETLYGMIRSNILAQDPNLLSLSKFYSILLHEERVRTISRGKEEHAEVMSFVVQAGLKSRWRGEGKDNDRPRGTARGYGQNKGKQQFVNSGSKGRGGVKANVVQASTKKVVGNSIISNSDKTTITGLSNKLWETLRTLLGGAKMGTNEKMTGCPVGLPNGNQIAATKEGIMVFDNKLTLNHVLYVPSLMCNLISLSQLLDETKCGAQFTDNFCVIQDCTSRMLLVSVNKERALLLSYDGDYNDNENEWTKFL
ncbi:hypothetical protein V6N11_051691 [Hibiscus sabdariffa]|uniref:Retrovirus-related Pol polyprotein from transposon TNT 1-94-like beta-barrel domain-containing protein n=1 Tax=Hibiscus sabdariffa TaxID=183260 RepID=A0ABR2U7U6_9ROSI